MRFFVEKPNKKYKFAKETSALLAKVWYLRIVIATRSARHLLEYASPSSCDLIELLADSESARQPGEPKALPISALRAKLQALIGGNDPVAPPPVLKENMERLGKELNLSPLDLQILTFGVLLTTDPLLQNDTEFLGEFSDRRLFGLLETVLEVPVHDLQSALSAEGRLYRTGLIKIDHLERPLNIKLDLISHQFAYSATTVRLSSGDILKGLVDLAPQASLSVEDFQHVGQPLELMSKYLGKAVESALPGVNVFMYGPPGTGKTQLTRLLGQQAGCPIYEVSCENGDGQPKRSEDRLSAWQAAQELFKGCKAILVFDEVENVFGDEADVFSFNQSPAKRAKGWLNGHLESANVPTIWVANSSFMDPAFARRFDMLLELETPPKSRRKDLLEQAAGELLTTEAIDHLAKNKALTPAVVTRAAKVVNLLSANLAQEDRNQAMLTLIGQTLVAQGHGPIGDVEKQMQQGYDPAFINIDQRPQSLLEGIGRAAGARLCFYGPPGTGKSAMARWLADELDRPLMVKQASDLLSRYAGQSEKNFAKCFHQAKDEGAVLMIEEIDSYLRDRRNANASWELSQANELLTQMEGFDTGLFIASTNLIESIDAAALRRFDLKLKFGFLLPEQVLRMFSTVCSAMNLAACDEAQSRAGMLTNLTPGDFAAIRRRHRFSPLQSADDLFLALRDESAMKQPSRQAMGFVRAA